MLPVSPTVLITGCDHGLGRALAEEWTKRGAVVYAGVLSAPAEPHPGVRYLVLDVGDDASVARAAESIERPLDLLVNNAGILGDIERTAFDELDFDEMARVYNINVLGTLRVTRAVLPRLLAGPTRLVVNVSSEAGSIALCERTGWYAYAMAKAALNQQSALIHNLLRDHDGRVLVVHPGHVRTFMRGSEDVTGTLTPGEAARRLLANVERFGSNAGRRPEFRGPDGEALPW